MKKEAVRNADSINEKIEVIVQKKVEAFYPINGHKNMASGVVTYYGRTFPFFVKWNDKKDLEGPQELYNSMIREGFKSWNCLEAIKEVKKAVLKKNSEDESELDEAAEDEKAMESWQSEKAPGKAPDPRTDEISGKGRTDGTDINTDKLVKEWEKRSSKLDVDKVIHEALNKTSASKRDFQEAIKCSKVAEKAADKISTTLDNYVRQEIKNLVSSLKGAGLEGKGHILDGKVRGVLTKMMIIVEDLSGLTERLEDMEENEE